MSRHRRRFLVRPLLACLAMVLLVGGGASVASATFRSSTGGSTSVKTDVVAPPTNFAAAAACAKLSVVFTWTASASTYTDGYELRYTANGTPHVHHPRATVHHHDSYALSKGVTYVFTLASTSPSSWTSITNPTPASRALAEASAGDGDAERVEPVAHAAHGADPRVSPSLRRRLPTCTSTRCVSWAHSVLPDAAQQRLTASRPGAGAWRRRPAGRTRSG